MSTNKKRPLFDLRFSLLFSAQILCLLAFVLTQNIKSTSKNSDISTFYRDLAGKLHSAGLPEQASFYYEKFLGTSNEDPVQKAKIAYSIAKLWDDASQYEKALSFYYQVGLLDPKSEYKDDAAKGIVAMLEKLKKFSAAKYAMNEQTKLSKEQAQGAVVVAKIGDKNIYLHDIHNALDQLPNEIKKNFEKKEAKEEFLKKYVADEILYDKAIRLGLNNNIDYQRQVQNLQKQILIQKVIGDEIKKNENTDLNDVENYYKANINQYGEPLQAKVAYIRTKSKDIADKLFDKLQGGANFTQLTKEFSLGEDGHKENLDTAILRKGEAAIGIDSKIVDEILAYKKDQYTKPILANGAYYLFKILSRNEEKISTFEQVQKKVEQDYKIARSQSIYQKLLEDTLAGESVQFFTEKL